MLPVVVMLPLMLKVLAVIALNVALPLASITSMIDGPTYSPALTLNGLIDIFFLTISKWYLIYLFLLVTFT
jgi:hypothetical protein